MIAGWQLIIGETIYRSINRSIKISGRSCRLGPSFPQTNHTTAKKYPLSVLYGGFPESIVAPTPPTCNVPGSSGAPTTTNFVITYVAKVILGPKSQSIPSVDRSAGAAFGGIWGTD